MVMSYYLAFDCSLPFAEVALLSCIDKELKILANSSWTHLPFQSTHSNKLVWEIKNLFKKSGVSMELLNFIVVGAGPGRFTGVRTAVTTAKTLSFSLKVPVYPLNSLKVLAEEFYGKTENLFVSLNAFKNQVYFGEFSSKKEQTFVLSFEHWQRQMEKLCQNLKQIICVSDLEEFYSLESHLKQKVLFKKAKLSAVNLVKIVLREKTKPLDWPDLKANYFRSAV